MTRPARADIDLQALRANLQRSRQAAPASRQVAVIKADAYGHGLVPVAQALAGSADALAVACLDEARQLRENGIQSPLLVLEGFFSRAELLAAVEMRLDVVVHHEAQLRLLEESPSLALPLTVWLKINTGMNRLGWPVAAVGGVWQRLQALTAVHEIILMSHLASADIPASGQTERQRRCFDDVCRDRDGRRSLANSAAILTCPATHADWVRPGIMLYGVSPVAGQPASAWGLRPVMTLRSRLMAIQHCRRGDRIGYGGDWRCPEDMPVGIVAIGYGDGYPRHAPAGTPVLLNRQRVALIGRVSMDMISIDLRNQPAARVGDEVVLWGKGLPVEEVAVAAGTIAYELLCHLTRRVRRVWS